MMESKYGKDPAITQGPQNKQLPFLKELQFSRERSPSQSPSITFANPAVTAEFPSLSANTAKEGTDKHDNNMEGAIKMGLLSKTSVGRREGSRPGPTRHRHFRLTEVALEYLHQFSHVGHHHLVFNNSASSPASFSMLYASCFSAYSIEKLGTRVFNKCSLSPSTTQLSSHIWYR